MPVVAIAFHESIAMEKLHEFFESPEAVSGAETRTANCPKCNLGFAVVLVGKHDPLNSEYIESLTLMIAEDCISALHKDEYMLDIVQPMDGAN